MVKTNEDSAKSATDYSKALRVIGCALEGLGVEDFELAYEGANYIVRTPSQPRKKQRRTALQILQQIFPRRHSPAKRSAGGKLIYTIRDIERLERDGQLRRQDAGKPDPHSLPQALRAIGAYLDGKEARLVQLSRRGTLTTIRYETALDGCHTERFTPPSLYSLFVRRYVKRSDRQVAFKASGTEDRPATTGLSDESWPEDEREFR